MSALKYHEAILTFFGCGKCKYAPGTFTSFITVLIWLLVTILFLKNEVTIAVETFIWLFLSIVMFVYGVLIIPTYSKILGVEDHPSIVLDEVVGQILALAITYPVIKPYYASLMEQNMNVIIVTSHILFCFISFRFFDIVKPSVIGTIDRTIKGGLGVMLDDVVCGVISGIFGVVLFKIILHLSFL